ncbi:retrovirus-related pol polyprotein from transposon TNT 1-94, partial [Tanacetum coccineum]
LGYQNPFYLKKAQRIKPTLYDGSVISRKHDVISVVDEEETLILEEGGRSKMLAKQNNPISKEKKINISPNSYSKLNKLAEDFRKHFVPQKELFAEQALWLQFSNPISEQPVVQTTPVRMESPSELPKISMVKTNALEIQEFFNINEWQAKLDEKDVSITKLKKHIESLKGKNVIKNDAPTNKAKIIALRMFKLDLEPLAPKLLKNRDAHIDYIKHARVHTVTLREIVAHARALRPLDSDLDSACKYIQRIQEVLVYVIATCPSLAKLSEKLVAVTPLNKNKKVRQIPTGRTFTIVGNSCPLTRFTSTKVEPLRETILKSVTTSNLEIKIYCRKTKVAKLVDLNSELNCPDCSWYLDSRCSKHMTGNRSELINFVHKFLGTVRFGNNQIAEILGYGDYQMGKAEAAAIACYTKNRSLIRKRHNKTLYELLHNRKSDLSYLHVFGALCYPTNHSEDIVRHLGPQYLTPRTLGSGLMPNPPSPTSYVLPSKKDWEILFQLMFNEYFNPPPSVTSLVPAVVALDPADSTGSPSLTLVDQDAPSPSTSQTPQETQHPVIPSSVEEEFYDIEVAHLDNDPLFGVLIPEPNIE